MAVSERKSSPRRRVASMRLILSASAALLIAITVVCAGWIAERNARETLTREIETRLVLEARNLALVSREALLSEFPELVLFPVVAEMQGSRDDVAFVVVLDHKDLIQGHLEARLLDTPFERLSSMSPARTEVPMRAGEVLLTDDEVIAASVPATHGQKRLGTAIVGLRRSYLDGLVTRARIDLAIVTSPLLVGGLLATFLLMSWLLRPVGALRTGLERIGRGDLETPMRLKDRTELGLLADTVNSMARQLKTSRDETFAKEQEIIDTQKEVIQRLGAIVESRSRETANHIVRVGTSAHRLARLAGLDETEADLILLASPMHDVGKVGISDVILNKPGRLTAEEFDAIKRHTTVGYELLRNSQRPIMKTAAIIAHEHHEKWDGTGYPRGIAGEEIHIYGRIVAIVDVFDALTSARPYKRALSVEETLAIMKKDRGKHFDPHLLDLFVAHIAEFVEIAQRHRGTSEEEELRQAA